MPGHFSPFKVTAIATGLALMGVVGTAGAALAADSAATPASAPAFTTQSAGWIWTARQNLVFSEYGGPTTIGSTAEEYVYAYCQQDGAWGWQTYAWVPSLEAAGWIRNGDLTGYTNPIPGLDGC
jgi:hypothetical protein